MAAYNIYEAKTAFSALIEKAEHGEETVIARAGKPVAKIVPINEPPPPLEKKRLRPAPGSVSGWDLPALLKALDEPWDKEEQRAFGIID
jgi:prevent-host-death family protein